MTAQRTPAASGRTLDALWAHHHGEFRDPHQIVSQWSSAGDVDPGLFQFETRGRWWDTLAAAGITLVVTREYEHLVMALSVLHGRPHVSFLRLPHPSGLAVDRSRGILHCASTRNPNQVFDLLPVTGLLPRADVARARLDDHPLIPVRSRCYPGSLYLHDLAVLGGRLHGNAVGHNAVVRLDADGQYERVWWPRCIDRRPAPIFGRNHLQLNSIAAGATLRRSFFSASTDTVSVRRPGHRNFPVDRRGVIFCGRTREPVVQGLTRPHSARLHDDRLWVLNSGYGEFGVADGRFEVVTRLPGWTRGLCFHGGLAFVGSSRVIPRFRSYAPGLDVDASVCGVHAIDVASGRILGSLRWPRGNQIFAVEWLPRSLTAGFPFGVRARRANAGIHNLFYAFETGPRLSRKRG